jgi:hypothetical protein
MIPNATPVAAPAIKPRRVRLGIDGVLVANMKPATAIHKLQRTMRIFMMYSQWQRAALIAIGCRYTAQEGNLSIG